MMRIVGWQKWKRRVETLKAELKQNPFWASHLRERHALEIALVDAKLHQRITGKYPPPETREQYDLYSFLTSAVRVHATLNDAGKARLAGAILGGLASDSGLCPLAFEMKMLSRLMSRGFDVEFHDLETGGGFDFLATLAATTCEVECKHVSADSGRKIHRRTLHQLGKVLKTVMSLGVDQGGGRHLRVTLPDRLEGNTKHQLALRERIEACIVSDAVGIDDDVCTVTVDNFELADSPFSKEHGHARDISKYLANSLGIETSHALLHSHVGHGAIVISFESRKPDRVLDYLLKRMKEDADRQFSRQHPGLLCVHMADITEAQLKELADLGRAGTVTGLYAAIARLMDRRSFLHSVAVMTDGEISVKEDSRGAVSYQETGAPYVVRNPQHPMCDDPILGSIFGR